MKPPGIRSDLRVALVYTLFGAIWILFSDRLLNQLVSEHAQYAIIQTYKGWGFVLASALLILALLRRDSLRREEVEKELRQRDTSYQYLFGNNPNPMWVYDRESLAFLAVNDAAIAKYGYSRAEFLKMTIADIRPVEELPRLSQYARESRPTLQYSEGWRHILKDGTEIEAVLTSHTIRFEGREAALVSVRDVTEKRRAERALRESQARLQYVLAASPVVIYLLRVTPDDLSLEWVSENVEKVFGFTRDNVLAPGWLQAQIHPEDRKIAMASVSQVLANGHHAHEYWIKRPDGSHVWIRNELMVQRDERDGQQTIIGAASDITESKRATEELELLFAVSRRLNSARSEEEALPAILSEIEHALKADGVAIALMEPDGVQFRVPIAVGRIARKLDFKGIRFSSGEGVSAEVFQTRQPVIIQDYASDPRARHEIEGADLLGPTIVCPAQAEGQLLGVMIATRERNQDAVPFEQDSARLLAVTSEMIGSYLQKVRLFEKTTTQLHQLETFHKIDHAITSSLDLGLTLRFLLAEITTQTKMDAAEILLLNHHTLSLEHAAGHGFRTRLGERRKLRMGEGYAGRVALTRTPLHIPDLSRAEDLPAGWRINEAFASYYAVPLVSKGKVIGVLELYARHAVTDTDELAKFLGTLADQTAIAIENARLFADLQRASLELELAYDATIEGWARAMELKDPSMQGHTLRVTEMMVGLSRSTRIADEDLMHIRRGALLHDIGKLGVPDHILFKTGPLTASEREIFQSYPTLAYDMLKYIEFLGPALAIPYCHRENWDGSGFPRGLKGEQIPQAARLFAIVNTYDALTHERPNHRARTQAEALEYLSRHAGLQFDPNLVQVFTNWVMANAPL